MVQAGTPFEYLAAFITIVLGLRRGKRFVNRHKRKSDHFWPDLYFACLTKRPSNGLY